MKRLRPRRWLLFLAVAMLPVLAPSSARGTGSVDLLGLTLGSERGAVERLVQKADARPLRRGERELVVETAVLPSVYETQRVLYEFDRHQTLRRVHLVVEPDPGADGADVVRLYEEVTAALRRRNGPPTWERSHGRGRGGGTLAALATGALERTAQWEGERSLRAGIPPRADGRVVIAVLVSETPLPRDRRLWGREDF